MKQKLFLMFALVLLAFQGWATSNDSLTTLTTGKSTLVNVNELVQGATSSVLDLFTSSGVNNYQPRTDETLDFGEVSVGSSRNKTFQFKTCSDETDFIIAFADSYNLVKMYSIEGCIIDTEVHKHTYNTNPQFPYLGEWVTVIDYIEYTWSIKVTYKPTSSGKHNIILGLRKKTSNNETKFTYYQLTGSAVNSTITSGLSSWDFGTVEAGKTATKTFTVKGTNLTGNLLLSSNNSYFTVSPTSISAADAYVGKTVTVTYKPSVAGTHSGTITISGGGADNKYVSLSGTCVTNQSITISPSTYDFGTVFTGEEKTKTFTLTGTNLNDRISIVNQLETTGGEYTISPESLPASGGTVTVKYKPTAAGSSGATFTFGSGQVSARLAVEGKCVNSPKITISKTSLDFGTVVKGKSKSMTFQVTGTDLTGSLTVSSNSSYFTVSPTTLPASGGTVTVTYKPTAAGTHSGTITISGGGASSKTISITGKCVVPAISVSPASLAFGTVVKGKSKSMTFTITGTNLTGNMTVSSNSSYFTVSPTSITAAQAAEGKTVTVTYKPTATGSHSGTITISGGDAANKTVSVSGKCVVPAISASPTSLAFGTVVKGKSKSMTFTITGTNLTGNLTASSDNSYFTVSPTSITAAQAAEGKTVTVTYKPTAAGTHSGTITISGGDAANKTVSVSGKCVVPTITTSTTSLIFGGYNDSRTFTVTGTNLTGNLTLSSNSDIFTVSPTSITASQAAAGVKVTVKCNAGINIQHATGKITISGGDASPKYVNLTLDPTSPQPYAPVIEPDGEGDGEGDGDLQASNGDSTASVDELSISSKVFASGLNIIIESTMEQDAVISDISGHAQKIHLKVGLNEIPVNASGIYIVRIREKTTKLMLK